MAGITLAQAETKLSEALEAHEKALAAESYRSPDGTQASRSVEATERAIDYWNKMVVRLSRGGIRITGGTPT